MLLVAVGDGLFGGGVRAGIIGHGRFNHLRRWRLLCTARHVDENKYGRDDERGAYAHRKHFGESLHYRLSSQTKFASSKSGNSGFRHYRFDGGSKIFEHDYGGVAARASGDGAAGMRGGARLVEALDGHAMLSPAGHGAHRADLGGALCAGVSAAVPEMRVHAFEVERAFYEAGEDFIVGQIG